MFLVHQLLENSAEKFPFKTAAVFKEDRLSYQDINEEANQLAHCLIKLGVKKGDRVGIYLTKSPEEVVSIFAVLKTGAIFVDINPHLKDDQVSYIVKDCTIKGLMSSGDRLSSLKNTLDIESMELVVVTGKGSGAFNKDKLKVTTFEDVHNSGERTNPQVELIDADLASIIYTSGSTGMPKGVMLTHQNIVMGANSVTEYLNNTQDDIILSILPFSFDYGLNQLTTCFQVSATIVLMTYIFANDVVDKIIKEKITGLAGIPTFWIQLLQAPNINKHKYENLRYITNSGGKIPVVYVNKLRETFPHTEIFLMYGFTEAFRSTYLNPREIDKRPESIGKAVPNAEVFLVNDDGKECIPGETGELIHWGPFVSKGYWGKPEETAKTIKQNPFIQEFTDLVAYSGDLVRKDEEGYLYFVSRKDKMIKSSGYRISPAEIEEQLYQDNRIDKVAVLGIPDDILGERIKVVITLKDRQSWAERDILDYCKQRLPSYMVPHIIKIIDKMPLTPHGKIDLTLLENV